MLEENSKLIAAIVENQNIGKLDQCSQQAAQEGERRDCAAATTRSGPPQLLAARLVPLVLPFLQPD